MDEVFRRTIALDPSHPGAWYNLGNSLRDQLKFSECIDMYARGLNLPPVGKGMEVIALLSLLEPQPYHREIMTQFGDDLKKENALWLSHPERSLFEEVERVKMNFSDAMNVLVIMLDMNGTLTSPEDTYQRLASYRNRRSLQGKDIKSIRKIHLIVQYFKSDSEKRQEELSACLKANVMNLGTRFFIPHCRFERKNGS